MKSNIEKVKIDLFCKTLEEFTNNLSNLYPNDKTLAMYTTLYRGLSTFYKEDIVKEFTGALAPYADRILKKDAAFFIENIHEDYKDSQFVLNEIEKVKSIWLDPETTEETKENIWKYLISFVKIGRSLKLC